MVSVLDRIVVSLPEVPTDWIVLETRLLRTVEVSLAEIVIDAVGRDVTLLPAVLLSPNTEDV